MDLLVGVLEQGLIYGILALGLYISFRILDFPDLTVEGSFPLGAALTAALLLRGVSPWLTLPLAFLGGSLAGVATGLIHLRLKVRDILSGIIVMTALYTVNLGIAGKANVPLFSRSTIFSSFPPSLGGFSGTLLLSAGLALALKYLLDVYLATRSGYLLQAAGDNPSLVRSLARDPGLVTIFGLSLANGLVALAGSVLCQQQRFFDISMGSGSLVMGLASVIIGLKLFEALKFMTFLKPTSAVLLGSIAYKGCVALAIYFGLSPNSMKLITAALFLVILMASREKKAKLSKNLN